MESESAILVIHAVPSDDDEVTVKKTKDVKLTSACAAYIEDAADVAIATGTGCGKWHNCCNGFCRKIKHVSPQCVVKSAGRRQIGKRYTHKN